MSTQPGRQIHHMIVAERLPACPPTDPGATTLFVPVAPTEDGFRLAPDRPGRSQGSPEVHPDLYIPLIARGVAIGMIEYIEGGSAGPTAHDSTYDLLSRDVLALPCSQRWRTAVSTALVGDWSAPLWQEGLLTSRAIGTLRAEARMVHRQLVPLWRRRTRHGRVLSLDAALGDGLSLHDLVAADTDLLGRIPAGVFEDGRLNTVLRGLSSTERQVVFAYAAGEGATWTEAAAVAGATDPVAFGEHVRRRAKRLAKEQARRAAHQCAWAGSPENLKGSLPIEPAPEPRGEHTCVKMGPQS
ncbi:hypothetical protein ACIRL3_15755 [Streptomyces sp. NPDC102384]|uniref:hypothetical protein n=1 Tax=Streptomyces sp. NPDC102384 TaxID=3366166 RepID=UPI0038252292